MRAREDLVNSSEDGGEWHCDASQAVMQTIWVLISRMEVNSTGVCNSATELDKPESVRAREDLVNSSEDGGEWHCVASQAVRQT